VTYHFAAEEYVMIGSHYPNYEHHHLWHERFRQDVSGYANQAAAGGVSKDLKLQVSFAIENWMLEHIQITDRSLAQYLRHQPGGAGIRLPSVRTLIDEGKLPGSFTELLVYARLVK
jgi:hemerythrin